MKTPIWHILGFCFFVGLLTWGATFTYFSWKYKGQESYKAQFEGTMKYINKMQCTHEMAQKIIDHPDKYLVFTKDKGKPHSTVMVLIKPCGNETYR